MRTLRGVLNETIFDYHTLSSVHPEISGKIEREVLDKTASLILAEAVRWCNKEINCLSQQDANRTIRQGMDEADNLVTHLTKYIKGEPNDKS